MPITSNLSITQEEIFLKNKKVILNFGKDIVFQKDFIIFLESLKKNIVILTDKNIEKTYQNEINNLFNLKKIKSLFISIEPGEDQKNRNTKELIENRMLENKFGKDTLLLAIGGGVICDLGAFVASTYNRGISLILIPTTLLAMVDGAIGGKTAVNTYFGKNLIGSFYQPDHIFIDSNFLKTLPEKEYKNGFAEIIKYAAIYDEKLFNKLYEKEKIIIDDLIYECVMIKKAIIEKDEKDENIRLILNFGHSIGHCIELLDNYNISHGEAVSLGMIFASYLSFKLKFLSIDDFLKVFSILKKFKFNLIFSSEITWQKILNALCYDKKAINNLPRFVLLEKLGKIKKNGDLYIHEVDSLILKESLIWLYKRFVSKKIS